MTDHENAEVGWRALRPAELEREYSPSSCVDDIMAYLEAYAARSLAARQSCEDMGRGVVEIGYGQEDAQTIDLVTPARSETPSPLVVFIHGGYWQELSKLESLFSAVECLELGLAFAAIDYTLAPHASLDEIVAECRSALAVLASTAEEYDIDPDRIVVAGSSAGAHLAAMVALGPGDWKPAALVLISGIFELEPLIGTTINEALRLDVAAARRNSPLLADLVSLPETIIAYGDNETTQFTRQSAAMASAMRTAGVTVTELEVPGRNHFDVVFDLCDESTPLGRTVVELVRRTGQAKESS